MPIKTALPAFASLLFAAGLSLAGCASTAATAPVQAAAETQPACRDGSKLFQRVQLIFAGPRARDGKTSDELLQAFLAEEVTPRFPDGLTLWNATGQWRTQPGRVGTIPSRVLLIWHESKPQADEDVEAIREAYKARFKQKSVMRIDGVDCVSF